VFSSGARPSTNERLASPYTVAHLLGVSAPRSRFGEFGELPHSVTDASTH